MFFQSILRKEKGITKTKMLAVFLSALLVLSLFETTAFADEANQTSNSHNATFPVVTKTDGQLKNDSNTSDDTSGDITGGTSEDNSGATGGESGQGNTGDNSSGKKESAGDSNKDANKNDSSQGNEANAGSDTNEGVLGEGLDLSNTTDDASLPTLSLFSNYDIHFGTTSLTTKTSVNPTTVERPLRTEGYTASYTISPAIAGDRETLKDFKLIDEGLTLIGTDGGLVADAPYRVDSVTVNAPVGQVFYVQVSVNGVLLRNTWTKVEYKAPASFMLSQDMSVGKKRIEVRYSSNAQDSTVESDFIPGTVEVVTSVGKYNPGNIDREEVAVVRNNAFTSASYLVAPGGDSDADSGSGQGDGSGSGSGDTPGDSNPGNPSVDPLISETSQATTTIEYARPTLEIETVIIDPDTLNEITDEVKLKPDDTVTYRITATNTSTKNISVTDPAVVDLLQDSALYYVSEKSFTTEISGDSENSLSLSSGKFNSAGQVGVWQFSGELQRGDSVTIIFTAQVAQAVRGEDLFNTAYATSGSELCFSTESSFGSIIDEATSGPQQLTDTSNSQYSKIQAFSGISGLYVFDDAKATLLCSEKLQQGHYVRSTDGTWSRTAENFTIGTDIEYKLTFKNDVTEDSQTKLEELRVAYVVPYLNYLASTWTADLFDVTQMNWESISVLVNGEEYKDTRWATDYGPVSLKFSDLANLQSLLAVDSSTLGDTAGSDTQSFLVDFGGAIFDAGDTVEIVFTISLPKNTALTNAQYEENLFKVSQSQFAFDCEYDTKEVINESNTVEARLIPHTVSVSGTVWEDTDRDGILSLAEKANKGMAYVPVTLYSSYDGGKTFSVTSRTTTDQDGKYSFHGLAQSLAISASSDDQNPGQQPGGASKAKSPLYKVEFGITDGATYEFSPGQAFVASPSNKTNTNRSHVKSISDLFGQRKAGDTGTIALERYSEIDWSLSDEPATNIVNAGMMKRRYTVTYQYQGSTPQGAAALPKKVTYTVGDTVKVAAQPSYNGYDFSGWWGLNWAEGKGSGSTFVMPAQNVVLKGTWTKRPTASYRVEHWLENVDGSGYYRDLGSTVYGSGECGTTVTAAKRSFTGFSYNSNVAGTKARGSITSDGSLVLRLYYDRNWYTVTYAYADEVPQNVPSAPGAQQHRYGSQVTVATEPNASVYEFSGWDRSGSFTMPAGNVVISGSWSVEIPDVTITPIISKKSSGVGGSAGGSGNSAGTGSGNNAGATSGSAASQGAGQSVFFGSDTPLSGTDTVFGFQIKTWLLWLTLLGIILSSAYAAVVIHRRRSFTRQLNEMFDETLES